MSAADSADTIDAMKRPIPPFVIDLFIALGLLWLGLENRSELDALVGEIYSRDSDGFNIFLIGLQTLPLAWRRRYPQTVLFVLLGAFAVDRVLDYPGTLAAAGMVLAFHTVGSELPRKRSTILGGSLVVIVVVFTAFGAATLESVRLGDVISTGLMVGVPLVLGREVHQRRVRTRKLPVTDVSTKSPDSIAGR